MDADALRTNSAWSGRRSRVVLTPRRWRQVSERYLTGDGDNKARSPGRSRRKPLKPLRGECRMTSVNLWWLTRMLFYFACEAAGASSTRHSLRPLNFRCASYLANLARITRRDRGGVAAPPSSPRKRGPITTGLNGWSKVEQPQSKMGATEYGSLLSQGRHRAADNANGSRRCRWNYTMPSLPPIYRDRQSSSLPLVGRVAHREQSERCDGWGCFRKQVFSHLYALPPPGASRHPPHKWEG